MNYGDYAYIEAFPRGMFQVFPDPTSPAAPDLRGLDPPRGPRKRPHGAPDRDPRAREVHQDRPFRGGLPGDARVPGEECLPDDGDAGAGTRYAIDSKWYGIPEFTAFLRDALARLTRDDVNAAIRRHLSAANLSVVIITKDAEELKAMLLADQFSPIKYDSEKPKEVLAEDQVIGAMKLGLKPESVRITPVEEVFAK